MTYIQNPLPLLSSVTVNTSSKLSSWKPGWGYPGEIRNQGFVNRLLPKSSQSIYKVRREWSKLDQLVSCIWAAVHHIHLFYISLFPIAVNSRRMWLMRISFVNLFFIDLFLVYQVC